MVMTGAVAAVVAAVLGVRWGLLVVLLIADATVVAAEGAVALVGMAAAVTFVLDI